jgi:hypothetical protein
MRTLLRSLILIGLVVWVGGLIFFGAVEAPAIFRTVLPMFPERAFGMHIAGALVRTSLVRLHEIGLFCGVIVLLLAILERAARMTFRNVAPQVVLLLAMIGLTAYMQFSVIPRMDALRVQAGTALDTLGMNNLAKEKFGKMHDLATRLEGVTLICGLAVIVLYARPEPN